MIKELPICSLRAVISRKFKRYFHSSKYFSPGKRSERHEFELPLFAWWCSSLRDVLHWNDKGELLYENKPIPGSHVVDLVNDTLRHRKGFEPVGWSVFARGLARMNVPEKLIRNLQSQSATREFKARVREETPESPSRWLPTPPVTLSSVKKQRRSVESPRPQGVRWLRL